jgi:hypothetical protein
VSAGGAARYRINSPGVVSDLIEGEIIGINLDTGDYYSLPGVASEIWTLVRRRVPVALIVEEVLARYDGDARAIRDETLAFLARLAEEGLIVPDTSDADPAPSGEPAPPGEPAGRRPFAPPIFERYSDMREFLLVDPIHEVDVTEWPEVRPRPEPS